MLYLKIIGCIMVIISCGMIGTDIAMRLKKRVKALQKIQLSIEQIAVYIRMSNLDINEILNKSLPAGLSFDGAAVTAEKSLCLNNDDCSLLTEFFTGLGMGDTKTEVKRCASYGALVLSALSDASAEVKEKYKLISICGWLAGAAISFLWW